MRWSFEPLAESILVIDDEPFRSPIVSGLEQHGWRVTHAVRAEDVDAVIATGAIRLTVLMISERFGIELVGRLRRANFAAQVLVVATRASVREAVEALHLGAIDYLSRPTSADAIVQAFERERTRRRREALGTLAEMSDSYIQGVLAAFGRNVTRAAAYLGIDRRTMQRKLAKIPAPRARIALTSRGAVR
jgi:two-component system, response regulator RegA